MKKTWIGIILLITIVYTKNVYAFSMGVSTTENYDGVSSSGDQTIIIRGGLTNHIAINYGDFWGDNDNTKKLNINVNVPSGVSIVSATADTDTITGSNGNYTVTINSERPDGTAVIGLQMPTPSSTTTYPVTVTATSYDGNNSQLLSDTLHINYLIPIKNNNCDSNDSVEITTSAGTPQKIGSFIGDQFALSTDVDKITINVTPASSKTKIYYGKDGTISNDMPLLNNNKLSDYSLNYGDNEFAFLIQSECAQQWDQMANQLSGNFMIGINMDDIQSGPNYASLNITRKDNRSKVNTLSTLSISNVKINFKPDLKTYIAAVPYDVTSVKISSTLKDSKSRYADGFGNRTVNLQEGNNDIYIKVIAENGNEAVYTIKITRNPNEDASLKKLTVNDKEVILKKDTLLYSMYVENNIKTATVKAEPTDEKATVEISNVEELKEGTNKITITVTAASGKKNIYVVNVIRDKLISENSLLKKIIIKNHKISFNPNTYEYTITKNKGEDKLDITVETENDKATYIIIGNKRIKDKSTVKIKVTAQDKKTTTNYLIHIKEEKNNTIFLVGIIAGVIFCLVGIVLVVIRKKKEKKVATAPPLKEIPSTEEETKKEEIPSIEEQPKVEETPKIEEEPKNEG